jgi:NAD(P)-dependent dehydrogenase (short-subunit alcohol dehydrogenase family)
VKPVGGKLDGKVALITGGSRGLGLAMAEAFADQGAQVLIASRKLSACQTAAARIEDSTRRPGAACAFEVDVASWSSCQQLLQRVSDRVGQIDVLVNNAGMSPTYPSVRDVTEQLFDKVIGVNLKGPFALTAAVGTKMVEAGVAGSIINISSIEVLNPQPNAVPYAAAKAGLEALTVGLARVFGPTVRVNAIRCGMFRTDIAASWGDPERVDAFAAKRTALRRVGDPREIVGAALFLAGADSSYCTGSVVTLDGGWR